MVSKKYQLWALPAILSLYALSLSMVLGACLLFSAAYSSHFSMPSGWFCAGLGLFFLWIGMIGLTGQVYLAVERQDSGQIKLVHISRSIFAIQTQHVEMPERLIILFGFCEPFGTFRSIGLPAYTIYGWTGGKYTPLCQALTMHQALARVESLRLDLGNSELAVQIETNSYTRLIGLLLLAGLKATISVGLLFATSAAAWLSWGK